MPVRSRARLATVSVFLVAGAIAAGASIRNDLATSVDLASVDYVRSETCRRCHEDHYQSWRQTFHRTMTQDAGPEAVLGDFENVTYTYDGVTSRFTRSGEDYYIETLGPEGRLERYRVARTVGSRRVQQYVVKVGDRYLRLPLAWNVEERRWFHLNGGFLHPDGSDFNTHTALWDANCIFCHNTKAKPGYDLSRQTFSSSVAQLGISCESCHGPGDEHISRNTNPFRRYALHVSGERDPSIVNPERLAKEAQVQICGHCHGQRMPSPKERIREFLTVGDPYTPGEDLSRYVTPIWRDSTLEGIDLSLRFWKDGTPRLTAYEYQSLLMTPDYQKGGLTCISCHTMHGGDPRGMIEEPMRGAAACLQCHGEIGRDLAAHTKHAPDGPGSDCYACHMPKIVYGILDVHPTHRIQKPDPSRAWRFDMPEACTLCHTNQTAEWAALEMSRQYGSPTPAGPGWAIAENARALLGGDVVQRAVAAMALGDERSYAADPRARLWAVPLLVETLEDNYPAIRHFAHRSLKRLAERGGVAQALPNFDPLAPPETRRVAVAAWRAWKCRLLLRAFADRGRCERDLSPSSLTVS